MKTGIPLCVGCVSKVKNTGQLKDVYDRAKGDAILADAFFVDITRTQGRRLPLFDDLYRPGATATAIARLLLNGGAAAQVIY